MAGVVLKTPVGLSIIEHNKRHKLNLTLEEYVLADFIYTYNKSHKSGGITWRRYYHELGFMPNDVRSIAASLKKKNIITIDEAKSRNSTTDLWNVLFDEDTQFEELWKLHNRGNKQQARKNFSASKRLVPYATLLEKYQDYINSVDDPQYIMNTSKWLDPKLRNWENEYEVKKKIHTESKMVY